MYPILAAIIMIIGIILFIFARKIVKENTVLTICLRAAGVILAAAGLAAIYFLLSGKLVLPLSAN